MHDPAALAERLKGLRPESLHVVTLPDFVCNAGAVIGYRSPAGASPGQVLAAVEATIGGLVRRALDHEDGPLAGACEQAGAFLRGWWGEPPPPPFAPAE